MNPKAKIKLVRKGVVAISELFAQGTLGSEDLERAAELLLSCRRTTAELRKELLQRHRISTRHSLS